VWPQRIKPLSKYWEFTYNTGYLFNPKVDVSKISFTEPPAITERPATPPATPPVKR
jgi:hypothetical protein